MYVQLSQSIWQAHASDRRLAADVEKTTSADNRTMRVLKQLAPTDYLLPIKRIATYGRDQHERLTLPGLVKGQQLLATRTFDEYVAIQGEIKDSFFEAVRSFCGIYPDIVDKAPKRLGKAYDPDDFPEVSKIKTYFDYTIRFSPVPDTGNWLLDNVDQSDLAMLRNEVENEKNEMFREATKELFERAQTVLDNLASQALNYVEGQSNGAALRDITINSVKDMADLVVNMNITGDVTLDTVGKEMQEKFRDIEAKSLRTDAKERSEVAKTAARLLEKLRKAAV
jgi:hypothetical protein